MNMYKYICIIVCACVYVGAYAYLGDTLQCCYYLTNAIHTQNINLWMSLLLVNGHV